MHMVYVLFHMSYDHNDDLIYPIYILTFSFHISTYFVQIDFESHWQISHCLLDSLENLPSALLGTSFLTTHCCVAPVVDVVISCCLSKSAANCAQIVLVNWMEGTARICALMSINQATCPCDKCFHCFIVFSVAPVQMHPLWCDGTTKTLWRLLSPSLWFPQCLLVFLQK